MTREVHAAEEPDEARSVLTDPGGAGPDLVENESDGSVAGLSGLSEMMNKQVGPSEQSMAVPPSAGSDRGQGRVRRLAIRGVRLRKIRGVYLLIAVLALALAFVGCSVWIVSSRGVP